MGFFFLMIRNMIFYYPGLYLRWILHRRKKSIKELEEDGISANAIVALGFIGFLTAIYLFLKQLL